MRYYGMPTEKVVALLAEGVDRNFDDNEDLKTAEKSPSSRRAWIEISYVTDTCWPQKVALLAEGVDRNCSVQRSP